MKVLILEDDHLVSEILKSFLESKKNEVIVVDSFKSFLKISLDQFELAICDLDLEEELLGIKAIPKLKKAGVYTICLTGRESEEVIEKVYESGCDDYIVKPFDKIFFQSIFERAKWAIDNKYLKSFINCFETRDAEFLEVLKSFDPISVKAQPVLITGETGTGKTHLARCIHNEFLGKDAPFINVNCSELSETLLESELFGHVKGAFTGATSEKVGKIKLADGGTLFLDELGTMPEVLQKKILKVIEEKSYYPVGSTKIVKSEFNLISATCDNLEELRERGKFRRDLFYRVSGKSVDIKPLRERKVDIKYLLNHLLINNKRRVVLKPEARKALLDFHWPGNTRQLKKTIELLQNSKKGIINISDLPSNIKGSEGKIEGNSLEARPFEGIMFDITLVHYAKENGLKELVNRIEEYVVSHCYEFNGEKVRKTVGDLKVSTNSFYKIMNRHKKREN